MMRTPRSSRPRWMARGIGRCWCLLSALALVLTGCGGAAPADPTEALVDAVDRTFSSSFAFDLQVEMDDAARSTLPSGDVPGGEMFGAVLDSLEITGHRHGDGVLQLSVSAMGQQVFELRQTDAAHLYLRSDVDRIAETFGIPIDREELLANMGSAPDAVGEMWTGLLDGRWVGIVGEPAPPGDGMMMGDVDPSEMAAAQREALGETPTGFAARFTSATPTGSDTPGRRALAVDLHTRAMAEAMLTSMTGMFGEDVVDGQVPEPQDLERIPETVGGITVGVSGRLIDRIDVDLFEVVRSLSDDTVDQPAGSLRLTTRLTQHGTADPVVAPDDVLEFAAEDLGRHHPGGSLPPLGTGTTLLPMGMVFLPMAMRSSVETSVEVGEATAVPVFPNEDGAAPPGPPGSPEVTPLEAAPMFMNVDPRAGPAGSQVTLRVEGFADGPAEIRWDDRDGPLLATAEGPDFTVELTVPADAVAGQHTFFVRATAPDANRGAAIGFEVTG